MSVAFNTSSDDLTLAEIDTVLEDLFTLSRQLIDLSASLPAEMSINKDAADLEELSLDPTSSGAPVPPPPQAYNVDMHADAREAMVSFTRIEQVCSKFKRGAVESSDRIRVLETQIPCRATQPFGYSNSTAATESFFPPAPSMYADATFPFAYAQRQFIPSYGPSAAYGPASVYNPSIAFRPAPFGGYEPPVANVLADPRFGRANPLNGPPPNFGVFETWGSRAQRSNQAYAHGRHGPIARSKFTRSSKDVRPIVNSQTKSPTNRFRRPPVAPRFIAAPTPRFPTNFSAFPFSVDAFQQTPTPPTSPRVNLDTSAASPVARMPRAETSQGTSVNRDRPVFTNPFDNNKVILEDTWSELGSTTTRQDGAPVENPIHETASGSARTEEASNQNNGFGSIANSRTKIEGLDYNVPFEDIFEIDLTDPRVAWWTDRYNELHSLGML